MHSGGIEQAAQYQTSEQYDVYYLMLIISWVFWRSNLSVNDFGVSVSQKLQ
jgi:hypothetical protein